MRVGFGFDTHRLGPGDKLIIGGIAIPHTRKAIGYSDSDVLLHAIIDAMLGAAALGDIGTHFPDNDPQYKGIDSKVLLRKTADLLHEKGYRIVNIDTTVNLEKPKLKPYIQEMRQVIADTLQIETDAINIKATTGEKMGFVGREEGVAAYAVVLIEAFI